MWTRKKEPETSEPDSRHFEVELEEATFSALFQWARGDKIPTIAMRKQILERLYSARIFPGPLIDATLPWDLAKQRGCSEADLVWDGAKDKTPEGA